MPFFFFFFFFKKKAAKCCMIRKGRLNPSQSGLDRGGAATHISSHDGGTRTYPSLHLRDSTLCTPFLIRPSSHKTKNVVPSPSPGIHAQHLPQHSPRSLLLIHYKSLIFPLISPSQLIYNSLPNGQSTRKPINQLQFPQLTQRSMGALLHIST